MADYLQKTNRLIMFFKAERKTDILIHVGLMLAIFATFIFIFFKVYLPVTTRHGETIKVPDLRGKNVSEIQQAMEEMDLRFEINDSTYKEDTPAYTILNQNPKPGSDVKKNRKIYLSVSSSNPPEVKIPPHLTGASSLKAWKMAIAGNGLKIGKINYVVSPHKDLVLEQFANGQPVFPGMTLPKGTAIDLNVGDGTGKRDLQIPDLEGLTVDQATEQLKSLGLKLGTVAVDKETEGQDGTISMQTPQPDSLSSIHSGESVDVWIIRK